MGEEGGGRQVLVGGWVDKNEGRPRYSRSYGFGRLYSRDDSDDEPVLLRVFRDNSFRENEPCATENS